MTLAGRKIGKLQTKRRRDARKGGLTNDSTIGYDGLAWMGLMDNRGGSQRSRTLVVTEDQRQRVPTSNVELRLVGTQRDVVWLVDHGAEGRPGAKFARAQVVRVLGVLHTNKGDKIVRASVLAKRNAGVWAKQSKATKASWCLGRALCPSPRCNISIYSFFLDAAVVAVVSKTLTLLTKRLAKQVQLGKTNKRASSETNELSKLIHQDIMYCSRSMRARV